MSGEEGGLGGAAGVVASDSKGEADKGVAASSGSGVRSVGEEGTEGDTISGVLEGVDLSIPSEREKAVNAVKTIQALEKARGAEAAKKMGIPERVVFPDGRVQEVAGVDTKGKPVFFTTHNSRASISSGAKVLNDAPYLLDGNSLLTAGVWDGGSGRGSHQEFGSRVTAPDGAGSIDHATHVIGTMAASGVVASAKGAAPAMTIVSYDWNSDRAEMLATGAATAEEAIGNPGKFLVSNHSYGYISGWDYVGGGSPFRAWEWWGDGGGASGVEDDFGLYNTYARDTDSLAAGLPFYLMVRSAGNDRNNNPSEGQIVALTPGSETVTPYNPLVHPGGDGSYRGGYDNISFDSVAKNVMTVGSVADAVNGGVRDPGRANISTFSSFGPVDDGRIKPDVVTNGESLYSTTSGSDISYGTLSGTSMSAPGVTGLAMLLAEDFVERFGYAMRASTLKGLIIHTADDRGTPGPDYQYGWGLVNGVEAVDLIRDHHATPDKNRIIEDSMARTGGAKTHAFTWDGVSPIKVTLCWTDPAGTATTVHDSRVARLRHNLNIRLISPAGTSYYPYIMPFVGAWTQESMSMAATAGVNNTDNVEQVLVPNPEEAGLWTVEVTRGNSFASSQIYSLLVDGTTVKEEAAIFISDLFHAYDGTNKGVGVETSPVGLGVVTTYNGSQSSPINAGVYQVVVTVESSLYEGSAVGTMEISKGDQVINSTMPLSKTFGDPPFQVVASSSTEQPLIFESSSPSVATVASDGMVTLTGAGEAAITVSQAGDSNYNPSQDVKYLTVSKGTASIDISGLDAIYDGNPKTVSVATSPSGLSTNVTYDGSSSAPKDPGSYSVYCEIQDGNYEGSDGGVLTIVDAVNGVTFEDWKNTSMGEAGVVSGEFDDPDGDGVPNLAEFHLGTDPLSPASRLIVEMVETGVSHNTVLFSPVSDRGTFTLEYWSELGTSPSYETFLCTRAEMEAGEAVRQIPNNSESGYYRLLYTPPQ